MATASRCCWPPESCSTRRWPSLERDPRDRLVGLEPAPVEAAEERSAISRTVCLSGNRVSWSVTPIRSRIAASSVVPAPAEDLDLARGRPVQPFEDLDRRRLARAVGAEQAEALAAATSRSTP